MDRMADSSPLAPPPMPPQGLMQHLQGRDDSANNSEGPTWVSYQFYY